MSAEFLLSLAAEAPQCRVIKLEEEPTPPKAGRLVAGSPDVIVLGGLGGEMLLEELRRGSHGTMTGFGFPEVLVAVVRRWFAGDAAGAAAVFDRYATLVRFENQALLNLPIRKLVYQRRGAIAHATVRAPGVPPDPGTVADLDDVLRRTGLGRSARRVRAAVAAQRLTLALPYSRA
jgi:4-hydroxy-tetrahydrodipicolinate synthase